MQVAVDGDEHTNGAEAAGSEADAEALPWIETRADGPLATGNGGRAMARAVLLLAVLAGGLLLIVGTPLRHSPRG